MNKLSFDNLNLVELENLQNTLKAELSLHEFVKQAWYHIEGDKQFIDGYHVAAICEHLEAVANRQIKNLLINMPPRFAKSTIISVAFPAWVWLRNPTERFLCSSYAISLANRDSRLCRALIQSPWYQERWGDRFQLLKDQNTKGRFDNNLKGYRVATSSKSSTTGEGGSILIADDPNNITDGRSEVDREGRIHWWNLVWSTRKNNKKNDCSIISQQRAHTRDISGVVIDNDELKEYVKLILPTEFKEKYRANTVILPSSNGKIWTDWRQKEGELLCPNLLGEDQIKSIKQQIGTKAFETQYNQLPSPDDGNIIKKEWFKWWKQSTYPEFEFIIQSWDTAFSINKTAAYSAMTTWGVFRDENYISNVMLLSMWRGRLEYVELRKMAKRLYYDYRDIGLISNPAFTGRNIDMCLIEAKGSGDPLIKDLTNAGIRTTPFNPRGLGDKEGRVSIVSPLIEAGRIWLPARAPHYERLVPFADEFLEAVALFPNLESNDIIDTMSQALYKVKGHYITNPSDPQYQPPHHSPIKIY